MASYLLHQCFNFPICNSASGDSFREYKMHNLEGTDEEIW